MLCDVYVQVFLLTSMHNYKIRTVLNSNFSKQKSLQNSQVS